MFLNNRESDYRKRSQTGVENLTKKKLKFICSEPTKNREVSCTRNYKTCFFSDFYNNTEEVSKTKTSEHCLSAV